MNHEKIIWTIGHSTRAIEEFVELLKIYGISHVIDVRRFPGSRKYPQFNKDNLESILHAEGFWYTHIEALGGRRKANPDSQNTVWRHPSFRGYADYMESSAFNGAFKELEVLASQKNCAIMCSEAVWWRCHRSMISDQLKANGWKVMHVMGEKNEQEHPYTKPADVQNGHLTYH